MATVGDVAEYILRNQGAMTTMKLQKLCHYSQAWHLVWSGEPLFDSRIEAWANGPVIPDLYNLHRGRFRIAPGELGNTSVRRLTADERSTIDAVLDAYGGMTAHQLSELSHSERPWLSARRGLAPMERGSNVISQRALYEYFDGLTEADG